MESSSVLKQAERSSGAPEHTTAIEQPIEGNVSAQLLQLQRQAGNRAVAGLLALQERNAGSLQRSVSKFRGRKGKKIPDQRTLNKMINEQLDKGREANPALFPEFEMIRPKVTDAVIEENTKGWLEDGTERLLPDAALGSTRSRLSTCQVSPWPRSTRQPLTAPRERLILPERGLTGWTEPTAPGGRIDYAKPTCATQDDIRRARTRSLRRRTGLPETRHGLPET